MSRTTPELLREALVHLELATEHASREVTDQVIIDAVCMRLSAGIEVLSRLDRDVPVRLFEGNWQLMWGMRNRIAHGYLLVDSATVRRTIEVDLPDMVRVIRRELADAGRGF